MRIGRHASHRRRSNAASDMVVVREKRASIGNTESSVRRNRQVAAGYAPALDPRTRNNVRRATGDAHSATTSETSCLGYSKDSERLRVPCRPERSEHGISQTIRAGAPPG